MTRRSSPRGRRGMRHLEGCQTQDLGMHPDAPKLAPLWLIGLAPVAVVGFVVVHTHLTVWLIVPFVIWAPIAMCGGDDLMFRLGWYGRQVARVVEDAMTPAPVLPALPEVPTTVTVTVLDPPRRAVTGATREVTR